MSSKSIKFLATKTCKAWADSDGDDEKEEDGKQEHAETASEQLEAVDFNRLHAASTASMSSPK